jgi:hypothetical protein
MQVPDLSELTVDYSGPADRLSAADEAAQRIYVSFPSL